ncbi:MAG: hypothetical protein AAFO83_00950 [Cyanobacteria bacterium J06607_13]
MPEKTQGTQNTESTIAQNYTPELLARIEAIKQLDWREIEQAAEDVSLAEKPKDETWKAQADKIAVEEFRRASKPIYVEQVAQVVHAETQAIAAQQEEVVDMRSPINRAQGSELPAVEPLLEQVNRLKANGLPMCDTCGQQRQTGFGKRPICPASNPDCPYLQA